jgi:parallel beta-helix repeat protein
VHDVNNIGICMIGGERWVSKDRTKVTRNGLCKGNRVARARSSYGDGYAAGIYVDGGSDIVVEDNEVTGSNLGIEVGAENKGTVTTGVIVRNNRIFLNQKAGLVFGGYDKQVGRVEGCVFEGNFCYHNDTHKDKNGELWIQIASKNKVTGNIFWSGADGPLVQSEKAAEGNELDNNTYFSEAGRADAFFNWRDNDANGFDAYLRMSKQDAHSKFERPNVDIPTSVERVSSAR